MINQIRSSKEINICGIGNIKGISINSGGHLSEGRRVSIIKKFGGKYRQVPYINKYIKEIAEENRCHTFIELTGGDGISIEEIVHTLITGKAVGMEVHHKLNVFDHRIESSEQLTNEEYKKKSNKSHKGGSITRDYNQFAALIKKLEADRIYCETI